MLRIFFFRAPINFHLTKRYRILANILPAASRSSNQRKFNDGKRGPLFSSFNSFAIAWFLCKSFCDRFWTILVIKADGGIFIYIIELTVAVAKHVRVICQRNRRTSIYNHHRIQICVAITTFHFSEAKRTFSPPVLGNTRRLPFNFELWNFKEFKEKRVVFDSIKFTQTKTVRPELNLVSCSKWEFPNFPPS